MKKIKNIDNLIIWQKWFDPFGDDEDHSVDLEQANDDDIIDEDSAFEDHKNQLLNSKHVKAIATPMGLIPYTENTASSKIFNFWIGHTNFSINQSISDIIEFCDGVEILDIFTRYRFRIAIGKAFDAPTVMKDINDKVYDYLGGS